MVVAGVPAEMKIEVIAHPKSKTNLVKKVGGVCHVYTTKTPIEGQANKEIIKLLTNFLGIKNNQIFLVSGEKSKKKIFEVLE